MNVLIAGAGGQLGQDCLRIMGSRHRVCGYDSRQLDVTQAELVRRIVEEAKPDAVVNCAAYTAVDACEREQDRCLAVNGQGAANLAEACAAVGCRLIHVSTDYVFDGSKPVPTPYTEEDAAEPLSAYGRSKLAGEQAVAERMDNFLILRTAWLYGMGGRNFLKTMLRLATAEPRRVLRVVNDQHGSLTWTMTLARQIERVLDFDLVGIAHATAEGCCTWFSGAKYFLEAMQVSCVVEPCTTAEYPTPARRPANSMLENRRLKEHGINLMRDWRTDVDEFARLHREELLAGK